MRMRDLADAVVLSRSGLTRLVDRLQREGLIDREQCASDARGAYAVLTETGRARLREAQPLHREGVRQRFLSRFSDDELRELAVFWARLQDVILRSAWPSGLPLHAAAARPCDRRVHGLAP